MKSPAFLTFMLLSVFALIGCKPDLVVDDLNVDWTGTTRTAEVTVRNAGTAGAGDFLVYINGDENPVSPNRRPQVRLSVPELDVGASIVLQADFAPLAHPDNHHLANVYQISVLVDPKGMVEESNEDNNTAQAPAGIELRDKDDNVVPENPPPLAQARLPMLFVHGHAFNDPMDQGRNYKKNWQLPLLALPSFKIAIDQPQNSALAIEPYYIRLRDQNRSVTNDAAAIGEAVERILQRHGDPGAAQVKVVIIGYSKGTISTRLYLKELMPASQPVSEFIAIAPPNHGLAAGTLLTTPSLALRQINNGYGVSPQCASFNEAESLDFIERLNGHAIEDTSTDPPQGAPHDSEAPGSRPDGAATSQGVLYVTLYADSNRDSVGGSTSSGDCQGRRVAKNLAQNAVNIEVPEIPGTTAIGVHASTVHTPEVICLALYAAAHHQAPPAGTSCTMQTVSGRQVPIIPAP